MTAVLFDMDGVVVDSERYWESKERETILPEAVPDQDVAVDEVTGRPYKEIYTYLDENYGVAISRDRFLELFDTVAREVYREAALMDGFHDLCTEIRAADVPIALVTSSPHEWLNIVVDRFDLEFDAIVSADDVPAGKPEPDIYEHAAEAVGRDPVDCIAVEDSIHGAAAATAAGTTCIGYTGVHDSLDPDAVDAVASDPERLRALLLGWLEDGRLSE
jgi:HAD superfamily hydrolase (TIGR01509 family)